MSGPEGKEYVAVWADEAEDLVEPVGLLGPTGPVGPIGPRGEPGLPGPDGYTPQSVYGVEKHDIVALRALSRHYGIPINTLLTVLEESLEALPKTVLEEIKHDVNA